LAVALDGHPVMLGGVAEQGAGGVLGDLHITHDPLHRQVGEDEPLGVMLRFWSLLRRT
jgi:hypothetical protein